MRRLSRRILDTLKKEKNCFAVIFSSNLVADGDIVFADLVHKLKCKEGTLHDQLRILEQEGYLQKLTVPYSGSCIGYRLTDKGAIWRYHEAKKRKQYFLEKWIDLVALFLSVCALALSIISLLLGQQSQP